MIEQLDLFDTAVEEPPARPVPRDGAALGRALREEGLARAEQADGGWDRAVIDQAIEALAAKGQAFSANDVRPLLPDVRRALIGARFMAASRRGDIAPIGYTPSTDPGTHGHPIRLWKGTT